MMKKHINSLLVLLMLVFTFTAKTVVSQNKSNLKKAAVVSISSVVVDENGAPISNATISSSEGDKVVYSTADGGFSIAAKENSAVLVEAIGYEDFVIVPQANATVGKVILKKLPIYTGAKDMLQLPANNQVSKRSNVGAVSTIRGNELGSYPDALLSNMLQGKILGLSATMVEGGLANNPSSLRIRGNSGIVTIVDGMERSIDDLIPEEIESIEVLKDVTAKILYGARAANGVLLITTKHGDKLKRNIKVNVEYGFGQVTRMPKYLDSYNYATLYNQARANDGLSPKYSAADLEGYKNSKGENDFRYPNVNFSDYFLENSNNFRKASVEFSGGNEQTQYMFVAGYTGTDGLQKVGSKPDYNRLNLRGNLDIKINSMISGFIGIAGQFDNTKRGSLDHAQTFSAISTTRPNEYPLIIDSMYQKPDSLGIPALGATLLRTNNLYGAYVYGGYMNDKNANGQTNFGLKFDFSKYIKGLSAKTYITFDNSFYSQEKLTKASANYAQNWIKKADGTDSLILTLVQLASYSDDIRLNSNSNLRGTGWNSNVNYNNTFGKHAVNADLSTLYLKYEYKGSSQDQKTANTTLRVNYSYDNKYIIEGDLSSMGSNKFVGDNRYNTFYAGGAAWVISEESFMNSISKKALGFLKLKASAGIIGNDRNTGYRLYQNNWINNGSYTFKSGITPAETQFRIVGNPNLKWQKSRQINVGIEALALNNELSFEANYFNELSFDQTQQASSLYPAIYGDFYPTINYGKVQNTGFEASLCWNKPSVSGLSYSIGGNVLFSKTKYLEVDQVNYPDAYRLMNNNPNDAIWGYVSEGLFTSEEQVANHARQALGSYGVGDIAYKDLNSDGEVNQLDRTIIGNSQPRVVLGLDINLKYRGWALYVLGTAQLGFDKLLTDANYYSNNIGEGKYTNAALQAFDPISNPQGIYPRLTTLASNASYSNNSDFWIEDASFFRLKNVELSYTFFNKNPGSIAKSIKIFTRGTNLFVLSKIKDVDPEAMNAGSTNYPIFRNFTAGLSVSF